MQAKSNEVYRIGRMILKNSFSIMALLAGVSIFSSCDSSVKQVEDPNEAEGTEQVVEAEPDVGMQFFDSKTFTSAEYGQKIYDLINEKKGLKGEALKEQVKLALAKEEIILPAVQSSADKLDISSHYTYGRDRTYVLSSPYNCGKCDAWHLSAVTCWALTEDGVMVTNYHCLEKTRGQGVVVIGYDLQAYPVTEVLVADQEADYAVFRVALPEGVSLKTFPMRDSASTGDDIYLVSHPQRRNFYFSKGHVAGYTMAKPYKKEKKDKDEKADKDDGNIVWLMTETGYIPGSSGGAIYNKQGEVIGMVSLISPYLASKDLKGDSDQIAPKIFELAVPVKSIRERVKFE